MSKYTMGALEFDCGAYAPNIMVTFDGKSTKVTGDIFMACLNLCQAGCISKRGRVEIGNFDVDYDGCAYRIHTEDKQRGPFGFVLEMTQKDCESLYKVLTVLREIKGC